ncbi:MAG: Ku protein [Candidatus Rokuibacteriota bacterium]
MAKAVWTGSLAFGLVTMPVRLYPATEPKDVRFHLVDARGRRVRSRRFVPAEEPEPPTREPGEVEAPAVEEGREPERMPSGVPGADSELAETEVAFEVLMRGYETEDGRMVLLKRDEIESVRPERSRSIEIEDFVDLADIDPVYFEKSYHIAPQRTAERPYALLLLAMERAGRVGIGRFVLRTKPHLVAIRPAGGVLGLETLFFGDEIRDGRDLFPGIDAIEVSDRELETAEMLIETLKTEWNPAAYSDTYREELLRRIAEKTPVEPTEEPAAASAGARAQELMNALKASVEAARKKQRKRSSRKRTA